MLERLAQDMHSARRYLSRRPIFTLTVSLTLALCIAAATTAFGLATAVLWRALPFGEASRLVFVWEAVERDGQSDPSRVTGARFAAWRDAPTGLSSIALFGAAGFTLDTREGAESVRGVRVSANYFDTLGIRPLLGRAFAPADEVPGNHQVVILSHAFWQERFGGRREAVGETVRFNGQAYVVIGVMPPVTFPAWPVNPAAVSLEPDARRFWVPIQRTPALDQSDRAHVFGVLARLAPGISTAEVVQRLNNTSSATADSHRAQLVPLREQFVSDARTPLLALAGAALAVLLIACANLAALQVSAFESRRAELAVRTALGAGAFRLVRQLALETLLVAFAGGAVGLLLARAALAIIPDLVPPSIPFLTLPVLDARVAVFAFALALVASVIVSGWPIATFVRSAPLPRGAALRPRRLVHRALVVSQIALTVALVAVARLLEQSLETVRRQDPGFTIDRVLVAQVGLTTQARLPPERVVASEERLLNAIAARPQVHAVASAYDHPLEANWSETPAVTGDTSAEDQRHPSELRIVSPGYFEALDVPLLDGRTFSDRDRFDGPGVAVVNEAFARIVGGRVLGRRVRSETPRFLYGVGAANEFEIVGIVRNERFRGLEQPALPAFYLSTRQFPQTTVTLLVKTIAEPLSVAADIRAAIRSVDPAITVDRPTTLDAIAADQLVSRRVTTDVIGSFATSALVLAALGMYALLAVMVGTRTREIGIRLAVGASPASVGREVMGDCLRSAAVGVVLGTGLALLSGQFIQSLLVDVSPRDPGTLGAVAAVLLIVAASAAVIPACRAARIDPVETLRAD